MLYRVTQNYDSYLGRGLGSPWATGALVELDPAQAAAVNVDAPGTLALASAPKAASVAPVADDPANDDGARDFAAPPNTRQVTAADARRGPGRPRKGAGA